MRTLETTGMGSRWPFLAAAPRRVPKWSPSMYSITRKKPSPSVSLMSSVGTTLGCRIRAASRASSRNMEMNSSS